MAIPDSLKTLIDESFPGQNISITLKSEWANTEPEFRVKIRTAIVETTEKYGLDLSDSQKQRILDLSQVPRCPGFQVSISHSPQSGGYAFSTSSRPVGFDLEVSSRVSEKIVARISSEKELWSAPSLAHLWVAKEAAFKAFSTSQIKTLSQVETLQWIPLKNNFWVFKAQFRDPNGEELQGTGISGEITPQHLCLFQVTRGFT